MRRGGLIALVLLVTIGATPAYADEPAGDDEWGTDGGDGDAKPDSDDGFDFGPPAAATPTTAVAPTNAANTPRWWSARLTLRSDQALWIERFGDNPFAKARQSVDLQWSGKRGDFRAVLTLHAEGDGAYLVRTSTYDDATIEAYRTLLQVRETYLGISLGAVEVTIGRQIVAYGEGDALSPLDVINPRDMREPGLADLVDIRVPVLASRVGYFVGSHRFEAMVIHESNFGFRSPPLGPFSPLPALLFDQAGAFDVGALLRGRQLRYTHVQPAFALSQQQVIGRWVMRGEGVDVGVVAGSVLDNQGVVRKLDLQVLSDVGQKQVVIPLDHLRYEVLGGTVATTLGSVLIKGEAAFERRRPVAVLLPGIVSLPDAVRSDAINAMVGLTWRGLSNTTLGLELGKMTLLERPTTMLIPIDATQIVARAQHSALQERLELLGIVTAFGLRGQYGWLARAEATWLVRDGMRVGVGWVTYQPGDELGPLAGLDRHDRVSARFRWDLTI